MSKMLSLINGTNYTIFKQNKIRTVIAHNDIVYALIEFRIS